MLQIKDEKIKFSEDSPVHLAINEEEMQGLSDPRVDKFRKNTRPHSAYFS